VSRVSCRTPTAFNQRAETPAYQTLDDIGQRQQVQLPTG
jgi:hypothetical protein